MIESFRGRPYAEQHFREIVTHARATNSFYRSWIADPESPPLLDRKTALEHNDEILNGAASTGTTSGSLGVPFRYAHDRAWTRASAADVRRFVDSLGGQVPCVRIIHTGDREPPPLTVPITASIPDQIDYILKARDEAGARAITTYATNAELLSIEVLRRGMDTSFVTRFGTYAETLQDHQRDLIRRAFPEARLWSTYSSMEFGLIAATCPHEPEFSHIMAHRLGVEVLRDDGSPAADGEPGQVFVTDYLNRVAPLIRYELGDLAVRGTCPCGRTNLPALAGVLGRVSGTLVFRDGSRHQFVALSVALREIPGVRQYQVVQDGIEELTVRVIAQERIDAQITASIDRYFGYHPERLSIEYVDEIPRGANGKYRTSICNI